MTPPPYFGIGLGPAAPAARAAAPLAPEIVAYQAATGISGAAARKADKFLSELRAAGAEPSLFWLGGSEFNTTAQTAAIIGGDATLVGVKAGVPAAEGTNACRFNLSKFFRWPNPAATKGSAVSSLVLMVWWEAFNDNDYHNIAHAYTATNRGPNLQNANSGGQVFRQLSVYPTATGAAVAIRNNPGSANDFLLGMRQLVAHLKPGSTATRVLLDAQDVAFSPAGVYNDHAYFYIGGLDTTSSLSYNLANAKIHAVVLAPALTETRAARVRAANAPFTSGFMSPTTTPLVVTMGDSTTQSRWGQFVAGGGVTANVFGGAWVRKVAWEDLAAFGTSLDYHVSQADNIVTALSQQAWQDRYFYYAPEVLEPTAAAALGIAATEEAWKARTLEFLLDIETRSGAQIIIGQYIKGNAATDTAGITPYNDYFEAEAAARGWHHVPFYDDPHSQVYTGAVPGTYGFYADAIHQSTAGMQVQAEVFAAAVPHPVNTAAPRFNLASPPVVTGTATSGSVLSCSTGTLHVAGTSYTYQWLADLAAISGATSSTFTLTASQVGKRVSCRVTAVKAGQNSASFTSAPSAAVT